MVGLEVLIRGVLGVSSVFGLAHSVLLSEVGGYFLDEHVGSDVMGGNTGFLSIDGNFFDLFKPSQ